MAAAAVEAAAENVSSSSLAAATAATEMSAVINQSLPVSPLLVNATTTTATSIAKNFTQSSFREHSPTIKEEIYQVSQLLGQLSWHLSKICTLIWQEYIFALADEMRQYEPRDLALIIVLSFACALYAEVYHFGKETGWKCAIWVMDLTEEIEELIDQECNHGDKQQKQLRRRRTKRNRNGIATGSLIETKKNETKTLLHHLIHLIYGQKDDTNHPSTQGDDDDDMSFRTCKSTPVSKPPSSKWYKPKAPQPQSKAKSKSNSPLKRKRSKPLIYFHGQPMDLPGQDASSSSNNSLENGTPEDAEEASEGIEKASAATTQSSSDSETNKPLTDTTEKTTNTTLKKESTTAESMEEEVGLNDQDDNEVPNRPSDFSVYRNGNGLDSGLERSHTTDSSATPTRRNNTDKLRASLQRANTTENRNPSANGDGGWRTTDPRLLLSRSDGLRISQSEDAEGSIAVTSTPAVVAPNKRVSRTQRSSSEHQLKSDLLKPTASLASYFSSGNHNNNTNNKADARSDDGMNKSAVVVTGMWNDFKRTMTSTTTGTAAGSAHTSTNLSSQELEELEQMALALKSNLAYVPRTVRFGSTTYEDCFSGAAAVDFLAKHTQKSRDEAVILGRQIVFQFNLFANVDQIMRLFPQTHLDSSMLQDSPTIFYRLLAYLPSEVKDMPMEQKMNIFEKGIVLKDRRIGLRLVQNCFSGSDAVSYLWQYRLAPSREEAVALGSRFVTEFNMFEPVDRVHDFADASNLLFRFVPRKKRYFSVTDILSPMLDNLRHELNNNYNAESGQMSEETSDISSGGGMDDDDDELEQERGSFKGKGKIEVRAPDYWQLREVAEVLERGVQVNQPGKDKPAGGRRKSMHKDTFQASRAVTFMVRSGLAKSRKDAEQLGQRLEREFNLMLDVTGKHNFSDSNHCFYFTDKNERYDNPVRIPMPLEELAKLFEEGVSVNDNKPGLIVSHRKTFTGKDAVDFLCSSAIAPSRLEAIRVGRLLVEKFHLFDPVTGSLEFSDDAELFRFRVPDKRPFLGRNASSLADLVSKNIPEQLQRIAEMFLAGVKVSENKLRSKSYLQTFVGSDAVSYMVDNNLAPCRKEAVEICRLLANEVGLFKGVDGSTVFKDDHQLYKFDERFEATGLISGQDATDIGVRSLPLEKIAEAFRSGVKVKDHKRGIRTHKSTFVGSSAVDFLVGSRMAESRVAAVDLGQSLAREFGLFEHVNNEHEFRDEELLYRFSYEGEILPLEVLEIDQLRLMEISKAFEANVAVSEHNVELRVYPNSFLGAEAVDFLVSSRIAESRKEAVQIGRALAKEFNLFQHVSNDWKFEDADVPYFFVRNEERYKGLYMKKTRGFLNIFESSDDSVSVCSSDSNMSAQMDYHRDGGEDAEWMETLALFEKKIKNLFNRRLERVETDNTGGVALWVQQHNFSVWASQFRRLDPRYQIQYFFDYVAEEGAQNVEKTDLAVGVLRPMIHFLPKRSQVFTVWRPTSNTAIRRMMLGEAVGKGLDIKGKSAKRGKLSGYVPFLQIGENKHKSKIRPLSKEGVVRVFYPGNARRARDIAADKLARVANEMIRAVEKAKETIEDEAVPEEERAEALDTMLLDMVDPKILYIDEYAPQRYGFEVPERLFWEAYFVRQDCTRIPGSQYDGGRPSQPAFQDMNFGALRAQSKEDDAPRACIFQNADPGDPMNPFELLMAYEENSRVMPVVSDFDCFLVGTKRVQFTSPLEASQMNVLKWLLSEIENVMENFTVGDSWTGCWFEVLKKAAREGMYPEMPRFGFGDPKSYSIMKNAVSCLSHSGAVRHGAECFNYYFPQDLDDEFLVVADGLPNNQPWVYVDKIGLTEILSQKIDEGYTFPLNPKWILCDSHGWKRLYDKMLLSDDELTKQAMGVWFPPESGLREQIERIYQRHPEGFYLEVPEPEPEPEAEDEIVVPQERARRQTDVFANSELRMSNTFAQVQGRHSLGKKKGRKSRLKSFLKKKVETPLKSKLGTVAEKGKQFTRNLV